MFKRIITFLFFLIVGVFGGLLWQAVLLPYLSQKPEFQKLPFVKEFKERVINIYPREEIVIQENTAFIKAIERVEKSIMGVQAKTLKGKIVEGSGFVLTSDGLVITLAELLPKGTEFSFWVDGERASFEVLKRDEKENLALVKIKKENLQTSGFADLDKIKIGQRVFLLGAKFINNNPQKIANEGIIKYQTGDLIRTNIFEEKALNGSPLFDIEGNILGINIVDAEGIINTIPISKIRQFSGL